MRPHVVSAVSLMALSALCVASAQAGESSGDVERTTTKHTSTATGSIEEQARRWRLTTTEYRRFQEAMAGPRGRFSAPNITPIEVLGIEAETVVERERYAALWVEILRADTAKVLAFTRTVAETWRRNHRSQPLVNRAYINTRRLEQGKRAIPEAAPIPVFADPSKVGASDELLLFTEIACDRCSADVLRLVAQLEAGDFARLDIYLLDVPVGDVAGIQTWAASLAIAPALVQGGALTLNFNGGAYQSLLESLRYTPSRFPVVMRRRGETYDLVSLR
ncbi:MAG: TIGR03759 family integrating conjugative element protein [Geminicoccaceae bacterium]